MSRQTRAPVVGSRLAALMLLGACSPAVSAPAETLQTSVQREAWTVTDPTTGVRILIEPLASPSSTAPAEVSEEALLRRVAQLNPGQAWFRVHELGPVAIGAPGRVLGPDGAAWVTPAPLPVTGARERLLYLSLVQGVEAASAKQPHRTRLVAGATAAQGVLRWERDTLGLELSARRWSNRERAEFLGDLPAAAASESSPDPAHAPPTAHE